MRVKIGNRLKTASLNSKFAGSYKKSALIIFLKKILSGDLFGKVLSQLCAALLGLIIAL